MIGPCSELECPDCKIMIKQYTVCKCGIMYHEDTDDTHTEPTHIGTHHIILSKYKQISARDKILECLDTETQDRYALKHCSLKKLPARK